MYILVGLLLISMALYVLLPLLTKSSGSANRATRSTENVTAPTRNTTPSPEENIDFQKEGSLDFIDGESGALIKAVDIEISRTESERNQGLMYRQSMRDGEAMLFIFDKAAPRAFWMKNTYISLDIIYIASDFSIVSIAKSTKPLSEQSVRSGVPARYVVEVPGGFVDAYGIGVGDRISFVEE